MDPALKAAILELLNTPDPPPSRVLPVADSDLVLFPSSPPEDPLPLRFDESTIPPSPPGEEDDEAVLERLARIKV